MGIDPELIERLELLGISSIANILGTIKLAKYFEMNSNDVLFTIATDSTEMYGSRIGELREMYGEYGEIDAAVHYNRYLMEIGTDWMKELMFHDKKRMHNLKYFTWIEQFGYPLDELDRQWYDDNYWKEKFSAYREWDAMIREFNEKTGLLAPYQN